MDRWRDQFSYRIVVSGVHADVPRISEFFQTFWGLHWILAHFSPILTYPKELSHGAGNVLQATLCAAKAQLGVQI